MHIERDLFDRSAGGMFAIQGMHEATGDDRISEVFLGQCPLLPAPLEEVEHGTSQT